MSNLTVEQQLAVDKENTNIIVSAGAGSGKTTVLKERVARILRNGVDIRKLIILTFTNNAALEMKERIRKIISEDETISKNLEFVDSSYITTFDSFAQSIVKKYGYTMNISSDFTIIDSIVSSEEKRHIILNIFDEYYEKNDPNFENMIVNFYTKDDTDLVSNIEILYSKYENILNKDRFLDNFNNLYYSDEFIKDKFLEFEGMIFQMRDEICNLLDKLEDESDLNTSSENELITASFRESTTFDELNSTVDFTLKRANKDNYTPLGKELKDQIKKQKDKLKQYLGKSKKELCDEYRETKNYSKIIFDIITELHKRYGEFKRRTNQYEFNDIALMAIEIVENNKSIRDEIKNNTYEIMIDEYQDTSDIQEKFISLIESNNVYMVGDVKQSIYRFRNANPNIFKNKYDNYKNNIGGFKIDLNKNFRSRRNVIDPINQIFNFLMNEDLGKINYKNEHQMVFGNVSYDELEREDYKLKILNYKNDDSFYSDEEIEAFIIAKDILEKINNKFRVTEVKNNSLIDKIVSFSDFCVLIDKSKNFELFKKIFEYFNIPTTIEKDVDIINDDETMILSSIIKLCYSIKNKIFDETFKHAYVSIARSYLYNKSDDEIFSIVSNNEFFNTDIFKTINDCMVDFDITPIDQLLEKIINKMEFYKKMVSTNNISERSLKIDKFLEKIKSLNKNYSFDELVNNLDEINKQNIKIEIKYAPMQTESVKIMTIHKSKGLEKPIVYLPCLKNNFSKQGKDFKFSLSENFGLITPTNDCTKTFLDFLYKNDETKENLYEKIRLFYVAMTRAKENLILVDKVIEEEDEKTLENSKTYHELLYCIKDYLALYKQKIELDDLNLTKDYIINKNNLIVKSDENKINVIPLKLNYEQIKKRHFSKESLSIIDEKSIENEKFGTKLHYVFEIANFKLENNYGVPSKYREYIDRFLKHDEVKDIKNANIYKELEIMFEDEIDNYHGFIDLLLEYSDHIDIIDYKLSNVDSPEYIKQLSGYKNYIEKKFNKKVFTFLYSINQDKFKEII